MDDKIKIKLPNDADTFDPAVSGRAEVVQPSKELPNGLTVEGQIAGFGLIAEAAADRHPRQRARRTMARTMVFIGLALFALPIVLISVSEVVGLIF